MNLDLSILHTQNNGYKERFLTFSSKEYLKPILDGRFIDAIELNNILEGKEADYKTRIKKSLVVFIDKYYIKEILDNPHSSLSRLIHELKTELSVCFFFNPMGTLHFTLAAENILDEEISKIEKQTKLCQQFEVVVKGFSVSNYINGRIFLNVHADTKCIRDALINYGANNYAQSSIGFLNLTRDLTYAEKDILNRILSKYEHTELIKILVKHLTIVEQDNSLMINPRIIKEISLG